MTRRALHVLRFLLQQVSPPAKPKAGQQPAALHIYRSADFHVHTKPKSERTA